MARAYEARLEDNPSHGKGWPCGPVTPALNTAQTQNTNSTQKPSTLPPLLPTPTSSLPFRNIPPTEIRDRRSKGLCFKCDEKWSPSHHCQSKVLLLLEAEEEEPIPKPVDHPPDDVSGDISSLHALSSQLQGRSLRVAGMYRQHTFSILIDSGSTHNFIKQALVERLGLAITPCPRFRVATGSGAFLVCQFCCKNAPILVQGITFDVDVFVLAIEGPDVVLGFPWLESLGKVSHDYSALTMEFMWNGTLVTIVGDKTLASQLVSLHRLQAMVQMADIAEFFAITQTSSVLSEELDSMFPTDLPTHFTKLLEHFASIFAQPSGLPPYRSVDHRIHLIEGSKPLNVWPHRYR